MVNLDDLEHAVLFVSSTGDGESEAYLNRETGEIFYDSPYTETDDDFPENVEDDEKYILIPSQRDLDLGIDLRLNFFRKHAPNSYDEAFDVSRRPKAYRRLRELIERCQLSDTWFRFEREALHAALKNWCAENNIEVAG